MGNFPGWNFQCGENSGGEYSWWGIFQGESTDVEPSEGNFLGGKLPVTIRNRVWYDVDSFEMGSSGPRFRI